MRIDAGTGSPEFLSPSRRQCQFLTLLRVLRGSMHPVANGGFSLWAGRPWLEAGRGL